MGELLLYVVVALTVAAIVFGVTVMISGGDPGLAPVEPDGRALPLPGDRPLGEEDIVQTRFDTALRGYRMSQVDQALQRAAYDIGYKGELIGVLEAEVAALREGRTADADVLRRAREAAVAPPAAADAEPTGQAPTGQVPAGQSPAGEVPAGQVPAGQSAAGQTPAGQAPTGLAPAGEPAAGRPDRTHTAGSDDPAAVVAGLPPEAAAPSGRAPGTTPAEGPAARPVGEAAPVERR